MAIKIQGSTIIDDSRNIVNSGIATLNYQGVAEVTIGSTSVGIGSTNKFTITPQTTQTAIGIGTDELITLAPNSGSDNIFQVTNASGSTKHFVVANNGNIGVGTTNPSRKLHVDGDFLVSDGSTEVLEVNGSAGNPLSIQSNSLSPAFDVTGIGSVGIGTTQPSAIFEVVSGGSEVFRISDAPSDNYLEIDTDKFVVNSSGDAGIGTTNPTQKLDVNGNARLRGEIRDVNDSPGTSNYVLASGGPGADWSWKVVTDVGAGNLDAVNIKQDGSNVGTGTATEFDFYENFSLTQPSAGIASIRLAENINITGINTVSGNLGIGTDSPQTTLHVVDEFLLSTAGAASSQRITQRAYTTDNGSLSWEGSAGQLFSITNNLTSGSIFSVNDVSGIPSIDVDADGTIQLAPFGTSEYVGVGKTNPTQKLDVNGNVAIGGSVYDNNDLPGTNGQVLSNVTGFGVSWTDAPTGEVNVNEISSGSYYIGAFETTGTTAQAYIETTNPVVLTSDGNIGIGTTNPQEKLHTIGDVMIQGTGGTGEQTLFIGKSATVLPNSRGVAIAADQNSSAFHDMVLKTSTNSSGLVERLRITSSGNVGIGTTNPEYDLDIGGSANAADPENAGFGTVRIAAHLGIGHTDLTRSTAKPASTYGAVLTLGGDHSTGDNPIIVFDAYPTSSSFNNILIGDNTTGNDLSGGEGNVLIGGNAGDSLTGSYNIALGAQAMNHSITGSYNYGIGYRTLFDGSGSGNVAFGREAGNSFGSGGASYNTFLGYAAGHNTTGAPATGDYDHNIIIGAGNGNEGFFAPKGGDKQLAIGGHRSSEDPFYWIVGDENENIGIGTTNPSGAADPNNTTILNAGIVTANFYYGDGSGLTNLPPATSITLGDESSDTTCFPIFATDATGDQAPKTDSSSLTYNASTGALSATIFSGFSDRLYVGNLVGTAVTAASMRLVAVGYNVLNNIDALISGGGNVINSPIAFGENSLTNYLVDFGGSGSCTVQSQIGIGIGCLSTFNLTSGGGSRTFGTNIVMGYESGRTISGGIEDRTQQNVIVGYQNVYNANFYNASLNSVFGVQSGYNITSGATGNALFGYQCGYNVTNGDYNTLLGYQAGYSVQTGQYNIGIGYSAGQDNMTGSRNIVIGYNRDVPNAAGNDQLVIGSNANDWIIGDSSYNVGFGTNNPSGAADPNNTQIVNAGIVTANFYYGDGSNLINLPAADPAPADGQDFNTGITTTKYASASNDIDGFTAIAVTFPSTAGRKYLVESIHVTNITAGDLYITSRIDYDGGEDVPFTNKVLIPEQGAIDIVDESFICNPSDNIRLAAYNGIGATAGGILNGLDCFITYSEKTDTNYIGIGSTTKSTFTDETVFTSNTNPSVINTITLTNNSDIADIDASVSMFRGGTIRQGYFVYNLTIPQNSSVQILPKAKRLNATDTIVVNSSSTDLGINVAGKYIT